MHNYRLLLEYARNQRRTLLLIFVLTLASSGLLAAQPWPMKLLVDHVLGAKRCLNSSNPSGYRNHAPNCS
jgi:hypothetical protein